MTRPLEQLQKFDGESYAEGSKRKFNDVLRNWCSFLGEDWQPEYEFSDDAPAKETRQIRFGKRN